jgi:hypothetical protein
MMMGGGASGLGHYAPDGTMSMYDDLSLSSVDVGQFVLGLGLGDGSEDQMQCSSRLALFFHTSFKQTKKFTTLEPSWLQ